MNVQLPLALRLKDSADFDSFVPGLNREVLEHLRRLTEQGMTQTGVYLWGAAGTGKSHLLQAVCHAAGDQNKASVYLPMTASDQFPCEALDGMENLDTVCIDDIQAIAGRQQWEMALIDFIERIRKIGGGLVITGNAPPTALGLDMPQLSSRLFGALVFQLQHLDNADMLQALQRRAERRGFELPTPTGRYLIRHFGQDMGELFDTLESLDEASLAAKRKLTIPFVRSALKVTR